MNQERAIGSKPFFISDEIDDLAFYDVRPFEKSFRPSRFSWRDKGVLSPVSNQHPHDTCLAHSLSRAHETLRRQRKLDDVRLDADQFHQCILGLYVSSGVTDIVRAVRAFRDTGAPLKPNDFVPGKPCPAPLPPLIPCAGVELVRDAGAAKNALADSGPIIGLMSSERRFLEVSDFSIYRDAGGTKSLHHVILIVGFDDAEQCWEVQNSLGSSWGEGGFGRIAYGHGSLFVDRDHVGFRVY